MKLIPMFLLCCASIVVAQESPPTQPSQEPQRPAQPRSTVLKGIEVKIAGGWYQPKLAPLNESFGELERWLGYRPWNSFEVPYLGALEVRYPFLSIHYVVGEVAGSFVVRMRDDDHSWASLWRGGVGYRVDFLKRPLQVSGQISAGLLRANFSRSYNNGTTSLNAGESTWYLAASAGAAYPMTSRFALEFSAGYLFAPKLKTDIPAADVDVKAPVVSLGLVVEVM